MILWEIDWRDPLHAFAPLAGEEGAHLLHGGDLSIDAEWSVLVAFPAATLKAVPGGDNSLPVLDAALQDRLLFPDQSFSDLPFMSGALGFVGYETAHFFEPSLKLPASPFSLPDMHFGFYDAAGLFSRKRRQAYIAGRSESACKCLRDALGRNAPPAPLLPDFSALSSNFSRDRYQHAVAEAIENILDGDYYQANLTHQLKVIADGPVAPFDMFRLLMAQGDASHGALLQYETGAIVSNSPERFFKVEEGAFGGKRIVAEPIKGTRPRGRTPQEDVSLAASLQADPKDRAENIMIADLLRNDLSRICKEDTIREDAICELLSLANVHHLVSRISGMLRDSIKPSDIFAALFPCGSVTGAPKVEAMNAIARIEGVGRGPYCGAIGYIDDRGFADFSVSIRTVIIENERVTLPVGGGVTLRSSPREEYEETIVKANAALKVLGKEDEAVP